MSEMIPLFMLIFIIGLLVKPVGLYMAWVYQGERIKAMKALRFVYPLEEGIYRLAGIDPKSEMSWQLYAFAMLLFNALGALLLYGLMRLQAFLPLNPTNLPAVAPDLAFNTAVSFTTNTNWQNYGGESTMSYLTQMLGLTVQNFVSAATGMAVLIALIRGLTRYPTSNQKIVGVGNFWVDVTRSVLYILLPFSLIIAFFLVSQGVVQTFAPSQVVSVLQPIEDASGQVIEQQMIAMGPAASQIAIKQLGSNGGGFFNVNSAHPLENPTPWSNLIELLAILLLPVAFCYTYGSLVNDTRQGWAILMAMFLLFALFLALTVWSEQQENPHFTALGVDSQASSLQSGGNMEGKEVRIGAVNSALWAIATTATSNGSVNSMHDSYTPLSGFALLLMMQLGEVVFGGVGCGIYGMLAFVLVAVFISGLMVGRTPEYLGKKIEAFEMKMVALIILICPMIILTLTALALLLGAGQSSMSIGGPHGFSQLLYLFSSQANNNGSAFAGFSGNTPFFNIFGGLAMLFGRFWLAVPILGLAGSFAQKKKIPQSAGTLPTHTPLFIGWLVVIILLVGALNFFPALALGPIIEQLLWQQGLTL